MTLHVIDHSKNSSLQMATTDGRNMQLGMLFITVNLYTGTCAVWVCLLYRVISVWLWIVRNWHNNWCERDLAAVHTHTHTTHTTHTYTHTTHTHYTHTHTPHTHTTHTTHTPHTLHTNTTHHTHTTHTHHTYTHATHTTHTHITHTTHTHHTHYTQTPHTHYTHTHTHHKHTQIAVQQCNPPTHGYDLH
jgi:hypothetical protein